MKKRYFLIVGKNPEILETLKRLIECNDEWYATIATEESEVYQHLRAQHTDAVLLSSGLTDTLEADITQFVLDLGTATKVIVHYGGGSGLLKNEIYMAFPDLIP